ncbi:MAG: hypothetical protein JOZ17_16055 [Acetobacteraceae bacterium]|nr:hypothetical protein [Acetobacteraceae bacterium]
MTLDAAASRHLLLDFVDQPDDSACDAPISGTMGFGVPAAAAASLRAWIGG